LIKIEGVVQEVDANLAGVQFALKPVFLWRHNREYVRFSLCGNLSLNCPPCDEGCDQRVSTWLLCASRLHRTRNAPTQSATNAIEFKRKTAKSNNLIDILPLITVWLQGRVLSEPITKSIAVPTPFAVAVGSRLKYREKCLHGQSGLRVSPLTPKNSTIKNRGQLLSFLFAAAPNRTMNL
jgi:hypothetical protein